MDKARLKHIKCIKAEIRSITREIESFPQGIVSDYAYSYPNGVKKVIPLIGEADCSYLRKRLSDKLKQLQDELLTIEDWLDTVEDEETRCILRLRYRNGMTLEQIGGELGYDRSVIGRKLKRCLNTLPTKPIN